MGEESLLNHRNDFVEFSWQRYVSSFYLVLVYINKEDVSWEILHSAMLDLNE